MASQKTHTKHIRRQTASLSLPQPPRRYSITLSVPLFEGTSGNTWRDNLVDEPLREGK